MDLQTYLDEIKTTVDRYSRLAITINASVNFEVRPGDQSYIQGQIHFIDGSVLHFKEFVDVTMEVIEKLTYSYHYQDEDRQLIFRYDNAAHKPPLPSPEHKHLPDQIIIFPAPLLTDILVEILDSRDWNL